MQVSYRSENLGDCKMKLRVAFLASVLLLANLRALPGAALAANQSTVERPPHPYQGRWRMTPQHEWVEWQTIGGGQPGEYLTDRLTDEAVRFIQQNAEQPFLLYFPHYAVHTPLQAKAELIEKYDRKPKGQRHTNPKYAAMIQSVDESVGRLELYNLREDLGEQKNLADEMPEKARQLHQKLSDWRVDAKVQMPRPNPEYATERKG
jgi:arylsulfatase A-like enzyme